MTAPIPHTDTIPLHLPICLRYTGRFTAMGSPDNVVFADVTPATRV